MSAAFAPAGRLEVSAVSDTAGAPRRLTGPMPYTADSLGDRHGDAAAVSAWSEFLPIERLARNPAPYHGLCAIALDAGRQDRITNVPLGTRAFSAGLTREGIRHTLEEYDGGHIDRARERFEAGLLPFFAKVFAAAATSSGC
jgi:hypothetical protein